MKEGDCCSICGTTAEAIADRATAAQKRIANGWQDVHEEYVEFPLPNGKIVNLRVASERELAEASMIPCTDCLVHRVCTRCVLDGHRSCPGCSETSSERAKIYSAYK